MKWPDRIPQLSGPVLLAYRVIWAVAFCVAVASMVLLPSRYLAYRDSEKVLAATGLVFSGYVPEGVQVRAISGEALRAGVANRDVVLRINGRPAPKEIFGFAAAVHGADRTPLTVTLRSASGAVRDVTLTRSNGYLADYFAGSGFSYAAATVVSLLLLLLRPTLELAAAVLLFFRRAREPVVAMLSLGFVLVSINLVVFGPHLPVALDVALSAGVNLLIAWGLLFFPDGRLAPRWWPVGVVITLVLTVLDTIGRLSEKTVLPQTVPALIYFGVIFVTCVARYLASPSEARQQMKFAVLSIVVFMVLVFVGNMFTDVIASFPGADARIEWLYTIQDVATNIGWLILLAGLYVALVRHRLYDADAAISRSVAYGALTVALLGIFAGSEKVIELLGEQYFGHSMGVLAGGIGAAFAAVMIVPLHHRLSHWAEHKFQKQLIRLKHGLPLLVGDMRETAPPSRIAAATLDAVVRGVRASRAALVIDNALLDGRGIGPDEFAEWRCGWHPAAGDGLDCVRDDPVLPMRVPLEADGHGRIGWLLLGPRPDGSFYGKDERETLAEIADPVARSLEIAAAREKRRAEEAQRWRAQESLNAEIRSVNGELVRVLGSLDQKLTVLVPLPPAEAAE